MSGGRGVVEGRWPIAAWWLGAWSGIHTGVRAIQCTRACPQHNTGRPSLSVSPDRRMFFENTMLHRVHCCHATARLPWLSASRHLYLSTSTSTSASTSAFVASLHPSSWRGARGDWARRPTLQTPLAPTRRAAIETYVVCCCHWCVARILSSVVRSFVRSFVFFFSYVCYSFLHHHTVLVAPLLDSSDQVLHLWIAGVAQHTQDVSQTVLGLHPSNNLVDPSPTPHHVICPPTHPRTTHPPIHPPNKQTRIKHDKKGTT